MKSNDVDMNKFQTIDELCSFIDANAYELERNWDILQLLINFRNLTNDESEKTKSQFEIDCLLFDIKSNILFSQIYGQCTNENIVKKYPDLNEFENEAIDYVKNRAVNSSNPILKARYNHLLWKCRKGIKNRNFALNAIDNYIIAIKDYYKLYEKDKNKDTPIEIGRLYESLVAICNETNSGSDSLKELTRFLLFDSKNLKFYTIHGILDDMLNYPKLFKPVDFENTLTIIEKQISKKGKCVDDFHSVNYYLPTAIKIAIKTNSDVKKWQNIVGITYLRLANNETEEGRYWIKQDYHTKAIQAFTLANNKKLKEDVEILYAKLKPHIKLPGYTHKFEVQQERIKKIASSVLKEPAHKVYEIIASGYFFPTYEQTLNDSKNDENTFLDYCTTIQFDKNKNIRKLHDNEIDEKKVFDKYDINISLGTIPFLYQVFIQGIESGHLTFENFINYIFKKTWIGKPHYKYNLSGEKEQINWVGLLSPSIVEFFLQTQAMLNSKYYLPSYVLCIDSLTLKIEGLLRDFCNRIGIPTSVSKKKGMQEIFVNNILEHETIKKYFDEDDLILLNYIFSNESGLNMRNNVAHCFYDNADYNLRKILLLIAALLRIGKYSYKEQKQLDNTITT